MFACCRSISINSRNIGYQTRKFSSINTQTFLPKDGLKGDLSNHFLGNTLQGTLIGRAWIPNKNSTLSGPSLIYLAENGEAYDISKKTNNPVHFPTLTHLMLSNGDIPTILRNFPLEKERFVGQVSDLLSNSFASSCDPSKPFLISPIDVQNIKAAGVTFVSSMLERVIEEKAKGEPQKAEEIRKHLSDALGAQLSSVKPASSQAFKLKDLLIQRGLWSQYMEVGLGVDAEIFTKSQPLSSVGFGAEVGIHPRSVWNNPEPEIVLVVNPNGTLIGATLGNDVNLRDFEGRSALLLGKAKDNNGNVFVVQNVTYNSIKGSCSLGPFIRLFDSTYTIDDLRNSDLELRIEGNDGYQLKATSSMKLISRDVLDLVKQTHSKTHQYPDGFVLFTGTMFAPTQDRDNKGEGFTHKIGDKVYITTNKLGTLMNTVNYSDAIPPWTCGSHQFYTNLISRNIL